MEITIQAKHTIYLARAELVPGAIAALEQILPMKFEIGEYWTKEIVRFGSPYYQLDVTIVPHFK